MEFLADNIEREVLFSSLTREIKKHDMRSLKKAFAYKEGDVVLVKVVKAAGFPVGGGFLSSSLVEVESGAWRVLYEGARVVTVLGNRESTFWNVASLDFDEGDKMQLVSNAGLCSYLKASKEGIRVDVQVLGGICDDKGEVINTKSYWRSAYSPIQSFTKKKSVTVFVGTSAEVGKTTALFHLLSRIRDREEHASILAVKISGTASDTETNFYKSYGATRVINLIDLGFPTSYTDDRKLLMSRIEELLASVEFNSADHVFLELGGDVIGGNNQMIIEMINQKTDAQFYLAAFDGFGAAGCLQFLKKHNLKISAVTGKCASNSIVKARTKDLCGGVETLSPVVAEDLRRMIELFDEHHGLKSRLL